MTAKATILRIRHSERKPEERAVRLLAAPHSQTRLEAHSCPSPSVAFPPHYGAPPPALGNTSSSSRTWALFQNPPPTDSLCSAPTCLHALLHMAFPELPITPALTPPHGPQFHTSLLSMHTCPGAVPMPPASHSHTQTPFPCNLHLMMPLCLEATEHAHLLSPCTPSLLFPGFGILCRWALW